MKTNRRSFFSKISVAIGAMASGAFFLKKSEADQTNAIIESDWAKFTSPGGFKVPLKDRFIVFMVHQESGPERTAEIRHLMDYFYDDPTGRQWFHERHFEKLNLSYGSAAADFQEMGRIAQKIAGGHGLSS